jgi:O-antigen ligase
VWLLLGFLSTVLVLTLSRGAIFAFLVGVIVLVAVYYRHPKRIMMSVATIVVGGVMALSLQGTAAVMNGKYDQTFGEAVAKSLNQLSLGLIDVRQVGGRDVPESIYDAVEYPIAVQESDGEKPAYDGYVAESTDIRVNLSRLALDAWRETPFRMLAGVGLGGAGVAMAESAGHNDRREIVQNEYVEVLLERGIIGLALFLTMLGGIMYVTRRQKWVWGILAAFMAQWAFFSGYPSALHIYLTLILFVMYCYDQRSLATRS